MLKSLVLDRSKGPIVYPKWPLLILAPVAAFVALAYVERFSVKLALVTPQFYIAWLASTVIVNVLMYVVHWVTTRFDAHYPWRQALERRLRKQLLAGIILPVLIACTLASIYFWGNASNIFETIWFEKYFFLVVILLTVVNLVFALYGSLNEKAPTTDTEQLEQASESVALSDATSEICMVDELVETVALPVSESNQDVVDPTLLNIACVFCCNKHCYCIDFEGNDLIWPHSFGESKKLLSDTHFFAINRSYLINFGAIRAHHTEATKIVLVNLLPAIEAKIMYTIEKASDKKADPDKQQKLHVELAVELRDEIHSKPFALRISYRKKADFYDAEKKFKTLKS